EAKRSFALDLFPEAKKRRGHRRLTAGENNMILDPARRRRLIEVRAARFDRVRLEIALVAEGVMVTSDAVRFACGRRPLDRGRLGACSGQPGRSQATGECFGGKLGVSRVRRSGDGGVERLQQVANW